MTLRAMFSGGGPSGRASRAARWAAAAVLGAALGLAATPASAQRSPDGYGRGDGGRAPSRGRGGFGGTGLVVPLLGIGGALISRAAERDREYVEEIEVRDERRPRRQAEPRPAPASAKTRPVKDRPPASSAAKAAKRTPPPPKSPARAPAVAAAIDPTIAPDEVLCTIRPGVSDRDLADLARTQGLRRLSRERFALTGATVVHYRIVRRRPVAAVVRALEADRRVEAAQPNHVFKLSAGALAAAQYAAVKMRLKEAHASATGAGVAVAVIDSGVDRNHPALKGAVADSFDAIGGPFKPDAHGTAVAGLAAARGELVSVAPAARILAARAFAGEGGGGGTTLHILRALDWASARGAKVVNMSFAGPKDPAIAAFIAAGTLRGAVYVAAAGNAGPDSPPLYPGAEPNVIAATATDADDRLLEVANRGAHLAVAAPGVEVLVAAPGGRYGLLSGTSMAAAEVSGLVALLLEARPDLAPADVRAALSNTARDLGAAGFDAEFGAGAVDARAALDAAIAAPAGAAAAPSGATAAVDP